MKTESTGQKESAWLNSRVENRGEYVEEKETPEWEDV